MASVCNVNSKSYRVCGRQIEWQWEYKLSSDSTWTSYNPNSSDIWTSGLLHELTPASEGCGGFDRQSSTLTRTLTEDDNDRTYRCYIRLDGLALLEFAAEKPVGTVRYQYDPQDPDPDRKNKPGMIEARQFSLCC